MNAKNFRIQDGKVKSERRTHALHQIVIIVSAAHWATKLCFDVAPDDTVSLDDS